MKVLGISGWSGSGKTSLVVKLIPELKKRGYSVSTLKHAHHKFDIDKPGKDSFKHREAGAKEVIISSKARWALMHENRNDEEAHLSELISKIKPVDLLLIEGFKKENFQKIEVWRGRADGEPLYRNNDSVIAIATTLELEDTDLPVLDLDNVLEICDFIEQAVLKTPTTSLRTVNECFANPEDMISVEEARNIIQSTTRAINDTIDVPISEALDHILADDLKSSINLPPADNTAVDGYAFSHEIYEQHSEPVFRMCGRSAAGQPFEGKLDPEACIKIFTGAVLPAPYDTIAMVEDCLIDGDMIRLPSGLKKGSNRRRAGEDVVIGDHLLHQGTKLGPAEIARLASCGFETISVFRKLKVGLLSTGDELQNPGSRLDEGKIFDSNRFMLKSIFERFGCEVEDYGIIEDSLSAITDQLEIAAKSTDLVISSGGVSMGDEDHVKAAVEAHGSLNFWRIAIKPGRPLALGELMGTPFVGLPGNPVAAMVCALQFCRALVASLSGETEYKTPIPVKAKSSFAMKKKTGRREWLRGQLLVTENGELFAEKFKSEGSGLISSLVWANGLIELDEQTDYIHEGDQIKFFPFTELCK